MCRFASVTVNLGPTFLSGALAANAGAVMDEPSCPLVQVTGHRLGANTVIVHIWSSRHVSCVLRIGGQKFLLFLKSFNFVFLRNFNISTADFDEDVR